MASSPAPHRLRRAIDTPTAASCGVAAATRAKDRGGTSAPRSETSQPAPRSRSASRATGSAWCSPGGAPSTTVPRLRPRRANRGPRRPRIRIAMPLARCSTATSISPLAHRRPMAVSAGARCRGTPRPARPRRPARPPHPPRPRGRRRPAAGAPAARPTAPAGGQLDRRAGTTPRSREPRRLHAGVTRQVPAVLARRQQSEAHVPVHRHVVHAEAGRRPPAASCRRSDIGRLMPPRDVSAKGRGSATDGRRQEPDAAHLGTECRAARPARR